MDKEYVVTLYRREDLEQFYTEMQLSNFPLVLKRPISRNTHYMMTEDQAEQLRQDPRVWGVEAVENFHVKRQGDIIINNESYVVSGNFWKGTGSVSSTDYQWGHLHCAGNQAQRDKGNWGVPGSYDQKTGSVEVFNSGRHVDVVICDDPVAADAAEWWNSTQDYTRFVQYQWFNQLNTIVNSIDDDAQAEPTGTITYHTLSNIPSNYYHGTHVTGTVAGRYYGWARDANIYNLAVTGSWSSGQQVGALLIFDYLRAFHLYKDVNPLTGERNPTITNHSYGGIYFMPNNNLAFGDVTNVYWQGVNYNAGNPGPSGWTQTGVSADFGLRFGVDTYPAYNAAVAADVQDAIDDGVVIIGAAGNDNMLMAEVNDANWNNTVSISGVGTIYLNRGAWPNSPDSGAINVGALNKNADFRRSSYSQFGPSIDVFAPGDNILSAFNSTGLVDGKPGYGGNYFYPIQGTSMASPQVCGVMACLASGKRRFTNADVRGHLQKMSIYGDMTFDVAGGALNDNTCRQGSPNKYLHIENPRQSIGFSDDARRGERTTGMTFPRRSVNFQQSFAGL